MSADAEQIYEKISTTATTLLKIIAAALEKDPELEKNKTLKLIRDHLKNDGAMNYKLVPGRYKDEIVDLLNKKHIPCICIKNSDNPPNYLVMVRDKPKDRMEFLDIQKAVFTNSTEMYMETSLDNMLSIAKVKGQKTITLLSFPDPDMMQVCKNQLYQNDVVFCSTHNGVGGHIIVNDDCLFSHNGKDLVNVELNYALRESRNSEISLKQGGIPHSFKELDIGEYTKKAARYDSAVRHTFAEKIKNHTPCILGSAGNEDRKNKKYLEAGHTKDGEFVVTIHEGNKIIGTLNIESNATVSSIEALISKHADEIKNMDVIRSRDFYGDKKIEIRRPLKRKNISGSFGYSYESLEKNLLDSLENAGKIAGKEVLLDTKDKNTENITLYNMKREKTKEIVELHKAEIIAYLKELSLEQRGTVALDENVPTEIKSNIFHEFVSDCNKRQIDIDDAFKWVDTVMDKFNDTTDRDHDGMVIEAVKLDAETRNKLYEERDRDTRDIEINFDKNKEKEDEFKLPGKNEV